jgi:GTP-binding protein
LAKGFGMKARPRRANTQSRGSRRRRERASSAAGPSALTVAIIGRPNVGKSTLFNRLVGKRLALVDDTPGVTRDRRYGEASLGHLRFTVIDTAGLEDAGAETLESRMRMQTDRAVTDADVALLLIDARAGLTPLDKHFADLLRRSRTPVVLVANKSEGRGGETGRLEAFSLGLGDPVPISAEHGEGMSDLLDAIGRFVAAPAEDMEGREDEDLDDEGPDDAATDDDAGTEPGSARAEPSDLDSPDRPIQLAIVGRPNVGKSTLINRLLGEERLLTGPEAGITRDSIAVAWEYRGRALKLHDTAGLRRRARVSEKLEKLSTMDTLRAIRFANVVILVLDATDLMEKQDLTIARMVLDEGRALVVAANKWDLVEDKPAALQRLRDRLEFSLPQGRGLATLTLSAQTGQNLDKLLAAALEAYRVWNIRVPTAQLNRWLEAVVEAHPPPLVSGRRLKLRYATQVNTRPPTFALFASKPGDLPDAYQRYLVHSLRERFGLPGVPIRLMLRKGKNPYV